MNAPLSRDAIKFVEDVDRWRDALDLWSSDFSVYELLSHVGYQRIIDRQARFGPAANVSEWEERWSHATSKLLELAYRDFGTGRQNRAAQHESYVAAVDAVRSCEQADRAVAAVQARRMQVRAKGRRRYELKIDPIPHLEVLDLYVERRTTRPRGLEPMLAFEVMHWFEKQRRRGTVGELPAEHWSRIQKFLRGVVKWNRRGLPEGPLDDNFELAEGLCLGAAVDIYSTMLAITFCADLYAKVLYYSEATLVGSAPDNFKRQILQINGRVTEDQVERFVKLLTFDPLTGNPLARPIVATGDRLLLPGGLLRTSSVERTLLRSTTADPSSFGKIGERLGRLANRFADILQSELPCKAATRLKMYRDDGTTLGDIDVLAWEEATQAVVALEVKWPVEALTIKEGAKIEHSVQAGVRQLEKCRKHIHSGAEVKLPPGWPAWDDLKRMNWHWYVATPGQIVETGSSEIRPLSYRLLWANLPSPTLQALVQSLAWEPILGADFQIVPAVIETAGLQLKIDTLRLIDEESDQSIS